VLECLSDRNGPDRRDQGCMLGSVTFGGVDQHGQMGQSLADSLMRSRSDLFSSALSWPDRPIRVC
jgi:hypothetical protein